MSAVSSGACPGGSGAAGACEPCQVREEAAVSSAIWVPPGCLPGCALKKKGEQCSPFLITI